LEIHIKIFSSETTGPIATKLWWNGPWIQNLVIIEQIVSDTLLEGDHSRIISAKSG
jgi:hypothetical protein